MLPDLVALITCKLTKTPQSWPCQDAPFGREQKWGYPNRVLSEGDGRNGGGLDSRV